MRRHLCFLDVGHGNATVLMADDQDIAVIDVGKHSALSEFLAEQQITQIRSVYLSHADEDHIGALVGLLGSHHISIGRVFLNTDASKESKVWGDLLYELDSAHRAGKLVFSPSLTGGQTEQLSGNVSLDILGPSSYLASKGPGSVDRLGRKIRSNSVSAVIAISVDGERIALLPADLDAIGLHDLLRSEPDLSAPILLYPHHGGLPGNMTPSDFADRLLPAVRPDLVVFSIGRGRHRTPNPRTVNSLRSAQPNARIVCTQLSEHCSQSLPTSRTATHLTHAFAQGRINGACCGGTIIVPLDDTSSLQPDARAHTNFIRTHVETPLCLRPTAQPTLGSTPIPPATQRGPSATTS